MWLPVGYIPTGIVKLNPTAFNSTRSALDRFVPSQLNDPETQMREQIFRLAAIFAGSAVLALVLPRWAGRTQEGMAASATAAMTFLTFGGVATLVSAYMFFIVARNFRQLPPLVQCVGIMPLLLTLIAFFAVWTYLIA